MFVARNSSAYSATSKLSKPEAGETGAADPLVASIMSNLCSV